MKKRIICSAFVLTFWLSSPVIGARASLDLNTCTGQIKVPSVESSVSSGLKLPSLPPLYPQSEDPQNKLPTLLEYLCTLREKENELLAEHPSNIGKAKEKDNKVSDTEKNPTSGNQAMDKKADTSVIKGEPLNEEGTVYDLAYDFQLKETDQMLLSFANQLLILQKPEGELRMYLYDPLNQTVLKQNISSISTSLSSTTITVISEDELRIYDTAEKIFIYFNSDFVETARIKVPDDCSSIPCITEKKDKIYYFSSENGGLKEFTVNSGQTRAIACGLTSESPTACPILLMNDQYLAVTGDSNDVDNPGYTTNFLNLFDYQITGRTKGSVRLWSNPSMFAVLMQDGLTQAVYSESVFSSSASDNSFARELLPKDSLEYHCLSFALDHSLMLTASSHSDVKSSDYGTCSLQIYNLSNGQNTYQTEFPLLFNDRSFAPEIENMVYLPEINMAAFQYRHDYSHIGLWDLNKKESMTHSTKDYSAEYFSASAPDTDGIEKLKSRARDLNSKYGVSIHIADDCLRDFPGYLTQPVYSTRLIQDSLDTLDKALSAYPENLFKQLNSEQLGILHFYLTAAITPNGEQSLKNAGGFYFHEGQTQYLTLDITRQNSFENTLYHEISHAIDQFANRKYEQSGFDLFTDEAWNKLNPPGFFYPFSYQGISSSCDWNYCPPQEHADSIYFTDAYAKTFPSEDRAQIMQYAMNDAQSLDYFKYPHIREKLSYLSNALRSLFDTTDWEGDTTWEKPLG